MRRSILWFCIVVTVLIVLLLWQNEKKPTEASPPVSIETNTALSKSTITSSPASASVGTNTPAAQAASNATAPLQNKGEQMREGLSLLNDSSIVFYGKLEDQFGNAVGDTPVNFSVRVYNGFRSSVDRGQITSDANGLFTISGYKGESIDVVPVKTGYVPISMSGSGIYSHMWPEEKRAHPDPNNPVVIKMWKLQGAEPLVDISKEYRLPFASTPIYFDLVAGKVVPDGGDLEVIITRAPGSLSKKVPADWSIQLKPVHGGIMESDYHAAQLTFEAPMDGYQDNYLVQMNHDDPAWYDNIHEVFFLKSRGGQVYAKFNLDFMINLEADGLMDFQFKGVANTNSSRNWEATAPQ